MIDDDARICLARLTATWPRQQAMPEPERLMWIQTLAKFRRKDVEAALDVLRETEEFMPSHAKVVAAVYAAGKRRMAAGPPPPPALPAVGDRPDPTPPREQLARLRAMEANPGRGCAESRDWWDCPTCVEANGPKLAGAAWAEAQRERQHNAVPSVCARCGGTGWMPVEVVSGADAVARCACYRPHELHEPRCSCHQCHYGPRRAARIREGRDGMSDREGPDPLKVRSRPEEEF